MAAELLVEDQIDAGQELLTHLVRDGFDVAVAFWVRTSEDGLWLLYIGSSAAPPENVGEAYRKVYACMSRIPKLPIALSDVKIIHASNPIAIDAIAIRDRHPGRISRYQGNRLGNMAIQEAYIYPPLPLPGRRPGGEERRLKKDVDQVDRPEDFLLTQEEKAAVVQLMSQGVNVQDAEKWIRKRREKRHPRPPIPAGTKVWTWPAAHWGNDIKEDPNPLLMVEGPEGQRGLTFMEDTEPVGNTV